jgi:16S rRNA (guanine527-N7)-methyltransferase
MTARHKVTRHIPRNLPKTSLEQEIHLTLRHHKIQVSARQLRLFALFYECLKAANRALNLTRIHSLEAIVVKHFIDSIFVRRLAWFPQEIMDVGCGAGFPGIPLKIMDPQIKLTLVEPVIKRVEFLKALRLRLGLKDVKIIGKKMGPDFQYPTKGIITRAFKSIEETLAAATPSIKPGGRIFMMKGPGVKTDLAQISPNIKTLYTLVSDIEYCLPATHHVRRLVIFERNHA